MAIEKMRLAGAIETLDGNGAIVDSVALQKTYDMNETARGQFVVPKTTQVEVLLPGGAGTPLLFHCHCETTFALELPTNTSIGNFQNHVVLGLPTNRSVVSFAVTLINATTAAVFSYVAGGTTL